MLYALLRSVAGVALRWFYRGIEVVGLERLPESGPMLLVVNHPNALVDALLVAWAIPRRITLTAKSTLFRNEARARFLNWIGVVPLVRASDVPAPDGPGTVDPRRNARAFDALRLVLRRAGAVVIFPEGISHDSPSLAPLRTGAARIALEARDEAHVQNLRIVPIGLTFERKEAPRTRVVVQVGHPIELDEWQSNGDSAVIALTHVIETGLRAVTLNYATADDASRGAALSSLFASLIREELPSVGGAGNYTFEVSLARRIGLARRAVMASSNDELRGRTDRLLQALEAFESRLRRHRVALDDVRVSTDGWHAVPFLLREGGILLVGGPVALWGAVNHWVPFHAARAIAMRRVESAADPAMRTILAGTSLVLTFYAAEGALVAWLAGWRVAVLYLVTLPIAADINFLLGERLRRATHRARTYLLFRRRPQLKSSLQHELQKLGTEALEIERLAHSSRTTEATA